ncbi:Kynurenine formamidase [Anaerolineales bacterium]|nr:Kynurenine formamidase [Anaerolineales bacterium]
MPAEIIDLTKALDENLYIYSESGYSDPPLQIEDWCSVQSQGYKVSRVSLGTQCGTHIDAPSHFVEGGAGLGALPVDALMGKYLLLDLDDIVRSGNTEFDYQGEPILFLKSNIGIKISEEIFNSLLALPCRVWVIVYDISVHRRDVFHFNRALAKADKYLVENVDEEAAMRVKRSGEIFVLPLRLVSTSGAPCRVVVRQ